MELAIAHISDVHIRHATDSVLARGRQVAAAISAACGTVNDCLLIWTGDIAFSGKPEEYQLAKELIGTILAELRAQKRCPVFAATPGNHDCDFSAETAIRTVLLDSVRKDPKQAEGDEIQQECLKTQAAFFELLHELSGDVFPSASPRMSWSFEFHGVTVRMLNSAWMSSLKEATGTLVFPSGSIAKSLDHFTITCLHHPPQWYTASSRRALWRSIAQSSDLVLTGHEHDPHQSSIDSRTDATTHSHFEGAVLQEDGRSQDSSFAVYTVNMAEKTVRTYLYQWNQNDGRYVSTASAGEPRPPELPLPLNRIRSLREFTFTERHRQFLDALAMNITHPTTGNLRLRDIFVYPDIQAQSDAVASPSELSHDRTVRGDSVITFVEKTPLLFLTGEKYSGRTALAKMLCLDLHERGFVPVYVKLDKLLKTTSAWVTAIERIFCEQYDSSLLQRYQQLPSATKVVIVDDVDQCCGATSGFAEQLKELGGYAAHVIVSCDTAALGVRALVRLAREGVPHYQIRPFGYQQREQLVQKWLLLGGQHADAKALVRKLNDATKTLNSIVGKGFVPSYPFFVLTILHVAESSIQLETKTSAHGYYIEQLIRTELQRGKQPHNKLDVTLGALSFVAFKLFELRVDEISDRDLRGIIQAYESEYALTLDYPALLDHLIERRMLSRTGEVFTFAYSYVYYFFVARYLSRNIERDDVRQYVTELCRISRHKKAGDILLFLAHFSNDSFVIAQILKGANEAYSDEDPINLREDISVVGELHKAIEDCCYEERGDDALAVRTEVMKAQDRVDEQLDTAGRAAEGDSELEIISRMIAALRNMEIVGQVLKNNPGHLTADKKRELATAAYGVGARIWRWFLRLVTSEQKVLVDELVAHLRAEQPSLTTHELKEQVTERLVYMIQLVSFSMVKRIALSIGAPELESTYRRLVADMPGDASQLVMTSIALDCFPGSAEGEVATVHRDVRKNYLSLWILQRLVLDHLHLFQLDPADKQRLCAAAGIDYKSALGLSQRSKRLPQSS